MIYFKNKKGEMIGKKAPSDEQKKLYKKAGFIECDENGKAKKKPKKKK